MPNFLQKISESLKAFNLPDEEKTMLVAVSGGPDSVVLLHALRALEIKVAVAHCNFRLRPEAKEEATFVAKLAGKLKSPVFLKRFDTIKAHAESKDSIQMAARRLRYEWFEKLIEENGFHYCATAHHGDDQAETLMMSLIKGGVFDIMQGIPAQRGPYIRPLLGVSKKEIMEYAQENEIEFRLDASNEKNIYLRNSIRNELIPQLEKINPSFTPNLLEKHRHHVANESLLDWLISPAMEDIVTKGENRKAIDLAKITELFPEKFMPEIIRAALQALSVPKAAYSEIISLANSDTGSICEISGLTILKDRNRLVIRKKEEELPAETIRVDAMKTSEEVFHFRDRKIQLKKLSNFPELPAPETPETHYLDFDRIAFPLIFRNWEPGDRMQPFGMKGWKKLSDVFIDDKLNRFQKQEAIIFEDHDQIVCLSGYRIADKVKIDKDTAQVLQITIEEE